MNKDKPDLLIEKQQLADKTTNLLIESLEEDDLLVVESSTDNV